MDSRAELARKSLDRLAEQRGDVTDEVIARYYAAMPDARASFELHGAGDTAGLEARMVAESVFLLLRWVEEPVACKIDQATTVVHHNDALEIGPRWYMGLVDAVLAVLLDTVPADAADELALWRELRAEIASFVDSLRDEFVRTIDTEPLIDGR
ncbi:MAG: hypothetical protein ACTHKM_06035 [Tsuneonella sp.]